MSLIDVQRSEGIAIIRLNRPEKRNAMSFDLLRELLACGRALARDRPLRGVVLAGHGASFSAGIDLGELANPRNRWTALWQLLKPGRNLFQNAFLVWRELPVPVIAAVHGHCFGAGMQLALAADIRIAAPDAQLSIMEARWGLVPDMGLSRSLRGLLPLDVAKELTFSARVIDGQTAHSLGLVTHVDADPLSRALALAGEFAERSPDAVLAAKRVLDAMAGASVGRSLALERRWQLRLLRSRNAAITRARGKDPTTPWAPRQYRD